MKTDIKAIAVILTLFAPVITNAGFLSSLNDLNDSINTLNTLSNSVNTVKKFTDVGQVNNFIDQQRNNGNAAREFNKGVKPGIQNLLTNDNENKVFGAMFGAITSGFANGKGDGIIDSLYDSMKDINVSQDDKNEIMDGLINKDNMSVINNTMNSINHVTIMEGFQNNFLQNKGVKNDFLRALKEAKENGHEIPEWVTPESIENGTLANKFSDAIIIQKNQELERLGYSTDGDIGTENLRRNVTNSTSEFFDNNKYRDKLIDEGRANAKEFFSNPETINTMKAVGETFSNPQTINALGDVLGSFFK